MVDFSKWPEDARQTNLPEVFNARRDLCSQGRHGAILDNGESGSIRVREMHPWQAHDMTQMPDIAQISAVLSELEAALKAARLWEETEPCAAALASQEPFCLDTLNFGQWLQFVFIVRIRLMIRQGAPLPQKSDIAAMAEEYFSGGPRQVQTLIPILRKFDQLISRQ